MIGGLTDVCIHILLWTLIRTITISEWSQMRWQAPARKLTKPLCGRFIIYSEVPFITVADVESCM